MDLWIGPESYDERARVWLDVIGGHYLQNAPPGCLFAVGAYEGMPALFGELQPVGRRLGLLLVGRPVARGLPQDGSVGEVTRLVCVGAPYATPSAMLKRAAELARARGMVRLIAYHDRTRHSGCVYRKAGFRKDGVVAPRMNPDTAWGSRGGRASSAYAPSRKRRWSLDLTRDLSHLAT